ncbi:hypothetical protein MITS9508_00420 [Synechococcus sp. MIT S9508]|nr:hypothetical protein MITS9508_00420 [Synechococcus sp. MIT S9508]
MKRLPRSPVVEDLIAIVVIVVCCTEAVPDISLIF